MKKTGASLLIIAIMFCCGTLYAWGIYGHKHIARAAIFALPVQMQPFYYNHADFITEESVVPDLRKYTMGDQSEFPRHYINLQAYNYTTPQAMPQTMPDAIAKYTDDTLQKNGMLPWYIQVMMTRLTKAFKEKNTTAILYLSATLGHYIADAHMPLHTSLNHNGQFTDQRGIHAFWESQLPEMFGSTYNYHTDSAQYIADVKAYTWAIIAHTYSLAETMLQADRDLKATTPPSELYILDSAGKPLRTQYGDPIHTPAYATKYNQALHGMVQQQMRLAIQATASYWYTAWVNAGKPNLTSLDPKELTTRNHTHYLHDLKTWQSGHLEGLELNKEFK